MIGQANVQVAHPDRLFIGGRWIPVEGSGRFTVTNFLEFAGDGFGAVLGGADGQDQFETARVLLVEDRGDRLG